MKEITHTQGRMFSIITITKNDLIGLTKTFASVVTQSCSPEAFEWIIKDAESSDGTKEYIESIRNTCNFPVRWLRCPDNGIYDAMNQGMNKACGTYILFLNSGDTLHDCDVLTKVKARLVGEQTSATFLLGDVIDVLPGGIRVHGVARSMSYIRHSLPTSHQCIFYNREHIGLLQYNPTFRVAGDYDFTARVYRDCYRGDIDLGFPVAVFTMGGTSACLRNTLLWEAFRIQKDVFKTSLITRLASLIVHFGAAECKLRVPVLYRALRGIFRHLTCLHPLSRDAP